MTYTIRYIDGSVREYESLAGADLHGANLTGANLTGANLWCSALHGADLRGAIGLPAAPIVSGLAARIPTDATLCMAYWHHVCGTAHCLYGWAVEFAGDAGRELEAAIGTPAAGALIWWASEGVIPNPYQTDDDARAWLLARKEAR